MENQLAQAYPFRNNRKTAGKPLVGISACLCGERVRYDGREKSEPELMEALGRHLNLMKICPEVAIGMGIPRPPIQLVQRGKEIEARGVQNQQQNPTPQLRSYALSLIQEHSIQNEGDILCGFVLKSRSPSCGFGSTPIHNNGQPIEVGNGIFADQLNRQLPWLPLAEEQLLLTAQAQQAFMSHCQLVHDFWQSWRSCNDLKPFHKQMKTFFDALGPQASHKLEALTTGNPETYLTQLMLSLKEAR